MKIDEYRLFAEKIESMIHPRDVTAISFLGDFNRYLPLGLQRKIMEKGSRRIPYMGFIVDPYCFFLSYEIRDEDRAAAMLPPGYSLVKTSLFRGGEKKCLAVFSVFHGRTSAFTGMRLECYLIARNERTGLISWIIADYETDTNSHDPGRGFCGYSAEKALYATTPYGELLVHVSGENPGRRFEAEVKMEKGAMGELDEGLWVEGNLSVDYGGTLRDESTSPFSLIFDPVLMKEARHIPLDSVALKANSYLEGIIDPLSPEDAALFPYSQHFLIRQDLQTGSLKGEEDLYGQIREFMDRGEFKIMAGDDIKKPLFRSMAVSTLINLGLLIFLAVKAFF